MVTKLNLSFYGAMDSGRNWYDDPHETYKSLRYQKSRADPSVHIQEVDGERTITSTYTNDVIGLSTLTCGAATAKKELNKLYEIKDLGELGMHLGVPSNATAPRKPSPYCDTATWNKYSTDKE